MNLECFSIRQVVCPVKDETASVCADVYKIYHDLSFYLFFLSNIYLQLSGIFKHVSFRLKHVSFRLTCLNVFRNDLPESHGFLPEPLAWQ